MKKERRFQKKIFQIRKQKKISFEERDGERWRERERDVRPVFHLHSTLFFHFYEKIFVYKRMREGKKTSTYEKFETSMSSSS